MHDPFGHHITYLRISVTDRCNERCLYCMPQDHQEWLPHAEVLTFEEIFRLTQIFAGMGVNKIRVTGGEPLTRRNVLQLFRLLSQIEALRDIGGGTVADDGHGHVQGHDQACVRSRRTESPRRQNRSQADSRKCRQTSSRSCGIVRSD